MIDFNMSRMYFDYGATVHVITGICFSISHGSVKIWRDGALMTMDDGRHGRPVWLVTARHI